LTYRNLLFFNEQHAINAVDEPAVVNPKVRVADNPDKI
jgi:hypothetical protein